MKNISEKILTLILILLLFGCDKDFLTIVPTSTVSIDVLYKTDKDYQDAVTGVYRALQIQYGRFWMFSDLRGDDTRAGIVSNTPGSAFDIDEFYLDNNAGILSQAWRDYYLTISRANAILDKIETADIAIVKNKERYKGEVKFLRALAYFDLARIFGDVPMVTTSISVNEARQHVRENVDIIYNEVIIPDLITAENALPIKYTGMDVGRATKGAARALLGKVHLTRGEFINAEAKLQEVTTMGYDLLPNFNDLFDHWGEEHHSEYIFDIEYEAGMNQGSPFTMAFAVSFQGGGALVVGELQRLYNFAPGTGGDSGSPDDGLIDAFDPNDLRKDITVAKGLWKDGEFLPLSPTGIKAFTKKYMAYENRTGDSPANWKVLRYADVLLMYAEALNENNKTNEALIHLNMVRNRAGLEGYSGLTQAEVRDLILTERRFELYLEGHRWFDLVRTGRALNKLASRGMLPYMTLFPIPLNEIELINDLDIMWQNPGYE